MSLPGPELRMLSVELLHAWADTELSEGRERQGRLRENFTPRRTKCKRDVNEADVSSVFARAGRTTYRTKECLVIFRKKNETNA